MAQKRRITDSACGNRTMDGIRKLIVQLCRRWWQWHSFVCHTIAYIYVRHSVFIWPIASQWKWIRITLWLETNCTSRHTHVICAFKCSIVCLCAPTILRFRIHRASFFSIYRSHFTNGNRPIHHRIGTVPAVYPNHWQQISSCTIVLLMRAENEREREEERGHTTDSSVGHLKPNE